MGILSEFVEVRVNSNNVKYYELLGYKIPTKKAAKSTRQHTGRDWAYDFSKTIMVKTKDLPEGSPAMVDVLCDMCKENKMLIAYETYNRVVKETGSYVCRECSQEKMENTMRKRYGVKRALQSKCFVDAFKSTCVERYGERYGKQFAEKAFETFQNKTGYCYPSQAPDVREKITQSLYKNGTTPTSRQQLYIYKLYSVSEQIELNYPISYYNVDICFPEEKLTVEYDGGFHFGDVITGRLTKEEFNQKEVVRNNIIKREGYRQMRIISEKDLLPQDDVLLQMLSDARTYFSQYPEHSWIEFNIDTSTVRNAEQKDGVPYHFGTLRTIKDSDLNNQTYKM